MKKATAIICVGVICVLSTITGLAAKGTVRDFYRGRRYDRKVSIRAIAPEKQPAVDLITAETAKQKALDKAGVPANEVKHIKAELDRERGIWEYEVEFRHNGFEYEADINAQTGEIIKFEKEYD